VGRPPKSYPREGRFPRVASPRPKVDIHSAPDDLDLLVDWFEQVSYQLVLLADWPLFEVERAVTIFAGAVNEHIRTTSLTGADSAAEDEVGQVLAADHRWFATSIEQLGWFLGVVQREDHGGHRQALGQYGRLFAEAMRRHRADERRYLEEQRTAEKHLLGPPGERR